MLDTVARILPWTSKNYDSQPDRHIQDRTLVLQDSDLAMYLMIKKV
ncbi:hypothetical protein KDK_38760 [Dictyobacter kobayashii]|uniref:Uncharacterized protein n=1 Tax=Dictyobacter kobayashii TaxID=2014872 RepID=A0A402ALT2_9CHLR|nr:hypothetical protein KDK_38760 [Dictyobacter kobayashii]